MTTTQSAPASRLLIVNERAGSMTGELEARLRREFAGFPVVRFDPAVDIRSLITEDALVMVAGGDGTVGHVARLLVDTAHPWASSASAPSTTSPGPWVSPMTSTTRSS